MYILKKSLGFWRVMLSDSGALMFKSLSRKTATEWRNTNMPKHEKLNEQISLTIWRKR